MTSFTFAHVADLHLDTPFSGLQALNPALAEQLRDASLQAWDRVVEVCLEREVAFLLVAGDIYDTTEASVRAQLRFKKGVERLSQAGILVFVVHGNHDPRGGKWPAIDRWPEGVRVFGHEEVTDVPVTVQGEVVAVVSGISYPERHMKENLSLRFQRSPDAPYHIGLLHCNVDGDPGHGVYAPCTLRDLRDSGLDYWALGHIHSRRVLSESHPVVVYPGNTQARHPNETGEKGFCIAQVEGGQTQLEWVQTGTVHFGHLHLDLQAEPLSSLEELQHQLLKRAQHLAEGGTWILRAHLHGRTPLHPQLSRPGTAHSLCTLLQDERLTGVWWDEVTIDTRMDFDREQRKQGEDFHADLLRFIDQQDAVTLVEEVLQELQQASVLKEVRPLLSEAFQNTSATRLLQQAETLALDHLEGLL